MLILPFKGFYKLTQEFGVNPERYSQFQVLFPDGLMHPMKGHNGLDFDCPFRTDIIAPHDGQVIEATFDPNGYGWYVKIENEEEGSVLAHFDALDVKVGYLVHQGDHIGWSDSSGNSTGNHLHWGYYKIPRDRANGFAGFIDQTEELAKNGIVVRLNEFPAVVRVSPSAPPTDLNAHGLDLNNKESFQVALDTWFDVASGNYVKKVDFEALIQERNDALQKVKELQDKYTNDLSHYSALVSAGYATSDDVNHKVEAVTHENTELKKELQDVYARNVVLAGEIQKMDNQSQATVVSGLVTEKKLKDAENTLQAVASAHGVKPTLQALLKAIDNLKTIAENAVKQIRKDPDIQEATKPLTSQNIQDGATFLRKYFLGGGE